jgi:hypothetical protein
MKTREKNKKIILIKIFQNKRHFSIYHGAKFRTDYLNLKTLTSVEGRRGRWGTSLERRSFHLKYCFNKKSSLVG